jgi:hypothetical protein
MNNHTPCYIKHLYSTVTKSVSFIAELPGGQFLAANSHCPELRSYLEHHGYAVIAEYHAH